MTFVLYQRKGGSVPRVHGFKSLVLNRSEVLHFLSLPLFLVNLVNKLYCITDAVGGACIFCNISSERVSTMFFFF